jgi:hypothetical protein
MDASFQYHGAVPGVVGDKLSVMYTGSFSIKRLLIEEFVGSSGFGCLMYLSKWFHQ